jgi:hypothetical protein
MQLRIVRALRDCAGSLLAVPYDKRRRAMTIKPRAMASTILPIVPLAAHFPAMNR